MHDENLNKLKEQVTRLDVLAKRLILEKQFVSDKAKILEKQLEAAEALHHDTVERISSVVTMIDRSDNER